MPGVRDRNLRSGDLYEELGLLLLRTVALVSPIPRQEDIGIDAFATLVRPEGSRRLLPDVSFVVQLKGASVRSVGYTDADAITWITKLEIPPPVDHAVMMLGSPKDDVRDVLREMMPHICKLLLQIPSTKQYNDFPVLLAMVHMMRRWGVDPDPEDSLLRVVALMAEGPELADEDVIRLRCFAYFPCLDLSHLNLREESLVAIPAEVERLAMVDVPITDASVVHLQRLKRLTRLNLSGTHITDLALDGLAMVGSLRWLNVQRTRVTEVGIVRLKANLPDTEVVY